MLRLQCITEELDLGPIYVSRGIMSVLDPRVVFAALERHQAGDWGDISREEAKANDEARHSGGRILSSYGGDTIPRFWIVSDGDGSATTVIFPEEY